MTVTYTDDLKHTETRPDRAEQVFTPVYARSKSRRTKPFKTWMILAPVGAVVLSGSAIAMMMAPPSTGRLAEAEPAGEAMTMPLSAPLATIPEPVAMTPAAVEAPAPAAAPVARAEPAPAMRRSASPPAARPVAAPQAVSAEPMGPRPFSSETSATAEAAAPAITPAAPNISVQPLD